MEFPVRTEEFPQPVLLAHMVAWVALIMAGQKQPGTVARPGLRWLQGDARFGTITMAPVRPTHDNNQGLERLATFVGMSCSNPALTIVALICPRRLAVMKYATMHVHSSMFPVGGVEEDDGAAPPPCVPGMFGLLGSLRGQG